MVRYRRYRRYRKETPVVYMKNTCGQTTFLMLYIQNLFFSVAPVAQMDFVASGGFLLRYR